MNNVRSWHRFGFLGFGGPGSPIETGALDQMISILVTITSPMEKFVFFSLRPLDGHTGSYKSP